jgi:hypothetical protein
VTFRMLSQLRYAGLHACLGALAEISLEVMCLRIYQSQWQHQVI